MYNLMNVMTICMRHDIVNYIFFEKQVNSLRINTKVTTNDRKSTFNMAWSHEAAVFYKPLAFLLCTK